MSDVIGSRVAGNLVYVDKGTHLKRWVDAIGPDAVKFIDDFVANQVTSSEYAGPVTITRVEAGQGESTIAVLDGSGGKLRISSDGNDNDGINLAWNGEAFALKTTNRVYFGAFGLTLSEVTQSDFFIGLSVTSTGVLGGVNDRVGFEKLDGSTDLKFAVEKDTTETLSAALHTMVAATAVDLEFLWDGIENKLEVFVDGASVLSATLTNLPASVDMALHWQGLAGAAQSPSYMTQDLDKIVCIQVGR